MKKLLIFVSLMFLIIGCGDDSESSSGGGGEPETELSSMTIDGTSYTINTALAYETDYLDKLGISVIFFAEPRECSEGKPVVQIIDSPAAELFFPKSADGTFENIYIMNFHGTTGENLTASSGFNGSLEQIDETHFLGWVNISNEGYNSNNTLSGTFSLTLCQ